MKTKPILVLAVSFVVLSLVSHSVLAGHLYGASNDSIYRYDPADWSISTVVDHSGYFLNGGLAYNNNDGYLYGASNDSIYRYDSADWSISTVVDHSGYFLNGGLAYIPEPCTLLLLGLGCLTLRRKKH